MVYYSGYVQGVGFRATAVSIARRHPNVRRWVRNLSRLGASNCWPMDRRRRSESFLADVRRYMTDYIRTEDVFERESDETLTGFRVTY